MKNFESISLPQGKYNHFHRLDHTESNQKCSAATNGAQAGLPLMHELAIE